MSYIGIYLVVKTFFPHQDSPHRLSLFIYRQSLKIPSGTLWFSALLGIHVYCCQLPSASTCNHVQHFILPTLIFHLKCSKTNQSSLPQPINLFPLNLCLKVYRSQYKKKLPPKILCSCQTQSKWLHVSGFSTTFAKSYPDWNIP